ncbi:toll/interleukin-1 receptor domain-containing protein [Methylovulum sp.]|uniref:toll/interleukin-1 receptor domain-containing protein n=1 Tax=Methylovulum sp. TaxID=1916980 RepID=UPI0026337EA3|nr:toll/interleukin-1 receptor domain-containing protein [Methylovulum sp.]MDD5125032.1 toll/interleukin-1 receptor domain-containing protein [Methylovulum sp.]
MEKIKLFISHSHKDVEVATKLVRFLERCYAIKKNELRCTSVDGYTLELGVIPRDQLRTDIEGATVVALISQNSLKSEWVFFELGAAWGRNTHVIPVLLPGIERNDLPAAMSDLTFVKLANDTELAQFIATIDSKIEWQKKDFVDRNSAIRDFLNETKLGSEEFSYFSDRSNLREIAPREIRYSPDWRTLREGVRSRLEHAKEGDHWILICISPEAFTPWKEEIERAIRNGVTIDIIYNDISKEKELGAYWNTINENGYEGVANSVQAFLPNLIYYYEKAFKVHESPYESKVGLLRTHPSDFPHFSISCIFISKQESKRSWALIAPYTPFKWEAPKESGTFVADWGFVVERQDPLYKKYKSSAISLLSKLNTLENA